MRLSARGRYAVMAMVELALRQNATAGGRDDGSERGQASLADIAQAQQLSLAYLEQLFGPLRRAGLVASARGPGGGYRLARPAAAISIAAVVLAVDESMQATRCEEGGPGCLTGQRCLTHDLWDELGSQIRLFLEGLSLADVVREQVLGRASPPRPAASAAPPAP